MKSCDFWYIQHTTHTSLHGGGSLTTNMHSSQLLESNGKNYNLNIIVQVTYLTACVKNSSTLTNASVKSVTFEC